MSKLLTVCLALLAITSPAISQTSGLCSVSMDMTKLGSDWSDTLVKAKQPPGRAVFAGCVACSPPLTVSAIASDDPATTGETIEHHTTAVLADRAGAERLLADQFEQAAKGQRLCRTIADGAVDRRTIAGLPFYGVSTVRRCETGATTVTMARSFYYEAVGQGCRFVVGFGLVRDGAFTDQNRAALDRALDGLSFSLGK